jgi:hypothetical protein
MSHFWNNNFRLWLMTQHIPCLKSLQILHLQELPNYFIRTHRAILGPLALWDKHGIMYPLNSCTQSLHSAGIEPVTSCVVANILTTTPNRPLNIFLIKNNYSLSTVTMRRNLASLILQHTVPSRSHLTPELVLRLVTPACPLWRATEDQLPFKDPFWAFYWPGGQATAR